MYEPKKEFMLAAIEAALGAKNIGDYAIGAAVVKDGTIIAKAGTSVKTDQNPVNHGEMVAIQKAAKFLGNRVLEGCVLYTTHEPCPMCASAAVWARMDGIVFGATMQDMFEFASKNRGKEFSWRTISISAGKVLEKGNPKLFLVKEFMRKECVELFHC
ncbi:MAG: nucleoside deaminase [Candidatus Diapherotrites archaeon]|nr:nucleoside deaminase [Candidatus Diapherotrites archaeon]